MKKALALVLLLVTLLSLSATACAEDTLPRAGYLSVGDSVYFGSYEQDANKSNGKEDIEWIVLDIQYDRALLLSRYALDRRKFNSSYTETSWSSSSLRSWLNDSFLDTAFSSRQRDIILKRTVYADENPLYNVSPGKDTSDKVFLLSIEEIGMYLGNDQAIICEATPYAIERGTLIDGYSNAIWWLRTPGMNTKFASYVCTDGLINPIGHDVNDSLALRPAIWVSLG